MVDEDDTIHPIFLGILRSVLARLGHELDAVDLLESLGEQYPDGSRPGIEVEEGSALSMEHIPYDRVEFLGPERIRLEEALGIDFEGLPEKMFGDGVFSFEKQGFPRDDICPSRVLEEIHGHDVRELLHESSRKYEDVALMFSVVPLELVIDAKYEHDLIREVRLSYDQMPPEPDIGLGVVGRKPRFPRILVDLAENSIGLVIGEHAEIAVDDPVELRLGMEPEAEGVVDAFFLGNVFSPREFHLVAVAVDLRRWHYRMKNGRLSKNKGDFLLSYPRLTPTLSFGGEGDRGIIHIFVPILFDIME